MTVINGSGSGDYWPGDTVTITATGDSEGYVFLGWTILSKGGNLSGWSEESEFVMPPNAATVVAIYGKVEAWFPLGDWQPKEGLLLPKGLHWPQKRTEQRIRVTFHLGDGAGRVKKHDLWWITRVLVDWFPLPEAQGTWGAEEIIRCFAKQYGEPKIQRNQAIPKESFAEVAPGVYEASVWHESRWTWAQAVEKAGEEEEIVLPKVGVEIDLGVSSSSSYFISRMKAPGALLPVQITEVRFGGNKYWELWADDCGASDASQVPPGKKYSAPQWKDVDGDGKPTNISQGERDYAVAFTRNTKPKIGAKFKVTKASELGTIKIKASGPDGLTIPEEVADVSGDEVTLDLKESSTALVNTIKFYDKKDAAKVFKLEWEVKIGDSDWSKIGTTKHTVYVTLGDPVISLRQETLFNLGCRNANGQTIEEPAVAEIWLDFRPDTDGTPRLLRVLPPGAAGPASPMTYYANSADPYSTLNGVIDLLATGNGRCGSFQELMYAVLGAQGIVSTPKSVYAPTGVSGGVAAAKADYLETYTVDPSTIYGNNIRDVFFVKNWTLSESERWTVTDLAGVPGQGNGDPIAIFGDHALIEYDGEIYDPSYGTGPFPDIRAWEDASIEGFGVQFFKPPGLSADFKFWTRKLDTKGAQEVTTTP